MKRVGGLSKLVHNSCDVQITKPVARSTTQHADKVILQTLKIHIFVARVVTTKRSDDDKSTSLPFGETC